MKTISTRTMVLMVTSGLLLYFATGCSNSEDKNSPSTQASNEDMEDIAEDYGAALAGSNEGMLGMWDGANGGNFILEDRNRENTLDDTLVVEYEGFMVVRVRDFFDVNNVWSGVYIPGVSARMEQTLSVEGTRESHNGNRSVTVSHHDSIEVTGLLPVYEILTLNGNGERNVEGEFHSRFRQNVKTFESHYVWTMTDLQLHNNRIEHPYPLDGTISVNGIWIDTHTNPGRDFEQSVLFDFMVYFDGSRYAQLVYSNGAVFWIDLDNGWCWHDRPGGGD